MAETWNGNTSCDGDRSRALLPCKESSSTLLTPSLSLPQWGLGWWSLTSHTCAWSSLYLHWEVEAESALLGFAPVVPGSLGISNLRLRPLIIPLSKLPNIWVCKIELEVSHKHAFPSGISGFVCQWSLGLQKGHRRFSFETKGLIKVLCEDLVLPWLMACLLLTDSWKGSAFGAERES